jgi:hypothetical protein
VTANTHVCDPSRHSDLRFVETNCTRPETRQTG